jgi:hypothetical protein
MPDVPVLLRTAQVQYYGRMSKTNSLLQKIPAALSSPVSVFIFIFLFVYLFIFGLIGLVVQSFGPSSSLQLIFGNYTNVLSALGAALAAGGTAKHAESLRDLHKKHDNLQASVRELHDKVDKLDTKR